MVCGVLQINHVVSTYVLLLILGVFGTSIVFANITGIGTANHLTKWTNTTNIINSLIYENGTNIGIGTTSPKNKLEVIGNTNITGTIFGNDFCYQNGTCISDQINNINVTGGGYSFPTGGGYLHEDLSGNAHPSLNHSGFFHKITWGAS